MALPPALVRSTEDEFQVKASFPGGRYRFSLTDAGRSLLCDDLELGDGATIPWVVFKILVVVGDAYLPNTPEDSVDLADDLAQPDSTRELTGSEAESVTVYLERGSYRDRELEALTGLVSDSPLGIFISVDDLRANSEKVKGLREIAAGIDDPSSAPEETDPVRIAHIGTATLGRRNLGRSVRQADYVDVFSQAIDIAIEAGVDAVIQSGRLFQRGSPKPGTIRDTREQLDRLVGRGIPFYATDSSKDQSTLSDRVPDLVKEGLIEPIGGRTITVDDQGTVCLHGVDAGLPNTQRIPAWDESDGKEPTFAGVVVEASDHPGTDSVEVIDTLVDKTPDAYFVGGIGQRVGTTYDSAPVFGPGPTENTLGKRVAIGDDPPDRFAAVYTISGESVDATFHELETRNFACLTLECTTETDIDVLESEVSATDVQDAATMVVLTGKKHTRSPSTEAVRAIIEDKAFCVRVWDERIEIGGQVGESNKQEQFTEPERIDPEPTPGSSKNADGKDASRIGNDDLVCRSPTILCVSDLQLQGTAVPELERVLDIAEANEIDAVVHVGDLFATASPDKTTIQAVKHVLSRIRHEPSRFCVIGGRRTVVGETDSLKRLETDANVERLGTNPTDVGSIAVYGFDHTSGDVESRLRDEKFTWASGSSHAICCLNQSIRPAVGGERADITAFDVVDAVEPYLEAIVAGGTRNGHEWIDDDLLVTYPGTGNPELLPSERGSPVGLVFDGSNDRALQYASISLDEQMAANPNTIGLSWQVLGQGELTDDRAGDPVSTDTPLTDEMSSNSDQQNVETLDAVRHIAASDWEATPDDFDTTDLVDLYGILSKARSDLERQRKTVRDALLSRTEPEKTVTGRHATIDHTVRTRQSLRDPDTVLDTIERAGIDPADVQSLDVSKAREALEETGNSFDDTLITVLELAGVNPDDAAGIDPKKVEKMVDSHDIDADTVFETETSASIVRKSLDFSAEEE